jgi:hypothetical protein
MIWVLLPKKRKTQRNPDILPIVDEHSKSGPAATTDNNDLGASTLLPKKKKRKTHIEPIVDEVNNPGPSSLPPPTDNNDLESSTIPTLPQKEKSPKIIPEIADEPSQIPTSQVIPSLEVYFTLPHIIKLVKTSY